jgi:hypothetical protein
MSRLSFKQIEILQEAKKMFENGEVIFTLSGYFKCQKMLTDIINIFAKEIKVGKIFRYPIHKKNHNDNNK